MAIRLLDWVGQEELLIATVLNYKRLAAMEEAKV